MGKKFWEILSETTRIIKAQPRHYLTLSLIFLLPSSFVSLFFNFLVKYLLQEPTYPLLILFLVFTLVLLISYIFTLCAFISITYSVYHSFFNQPIKLKEAINSITTYLFPLFATDNIIDTIFSLFALLYIGGVYIQAHSLLVLVSLKLVFLAFMMYLGVHLSLVNVIVVLESVMVFEPLRRSWKLVKGMKRLIFSIFTLLGFLQSILVTGRKRLILSTLSLIGSLQSMLAWLTGYSWVLILVISPIIAMLSLYSIADLTVLYIYCKEENEKIVDEEFEKERDEARLSLIGS